MRIAIYIVTLAVKDDFMCKRLRLVEYYLICRVFI